ncbi:MAG: RimK family alpha-L-glutamate ligase, partial [Nitrospinae bacterium]|nr:RimK family alpha-L-glutamate ligase [Nitrospinota bacterium]
AKVESVEATPVQAAMAARAAALLGLDYAGVDFLVGPGGADYIIEVNGIPGWRGLQSVARLNVAGAIADVVVHEACQTPHSSRGR